MQIRAALLASTVFGPMAICSVHSSHADDCAWCQRRRAQLQQAAPKVPELQLNELIANEKVAFERLAQTPTPPALKLLADYELRATEAWARSGHLSQERVIPLAISNMTSALQLLTDLPEGLRLNESLSPLRENVLGAFFKAHNLTPDKFGLAASYAMPLYFLAILYIPGFLDQGAFQALALTLLGTYEALSVADFYQAYKREAQIVQIAQRALRSCEQHLGGPVNPRLQ